MACQTRKFQLCFAHDRSGRKTAPLDWLLCEAECWIRRTTELIQQASFEVLKTTCSICFVTSECSPYCQKTGRSHINKAGICRAAPLHVPDSNCSTFAREADRHHARSCGNCWSISLPSQVGDQRILASLPVSLLCSHSVQGCLYSHQRIAPDERKVGGPPATLSQRGFQQKQTVNQDLNMQHMYYMVELQALWEP